MSDNNLRFRDGLLNSQTMNIELRERYEREVADMLEMKLDGVRKWSLIGSIAFTSMTGVLFGYNAIAYPDIPALIRISFGGGTVFSLAWIVMVVRILMRGSLKKRTDPAMQAYWVWGVVLLNMTVILLLGGQEPDSVRSVFMAVSGLVFLLIGAMFMLANRIEQSELQIQERLLRIELRLAELSPRKPE